MDSLQRELMELGLTNGESKAYIALLELGPTTVGPLAKKSGVAYSNIYEVLERLIRKGLASFVIREGTKHFQALEPENLLNYLDEQEKGIEKQKKILLKALPLFRSLQKMHPEQQAEIFIGLKGVRAAYAKLVSGQIRGDWLFFYIHRKEYADVADRFYLSIKNLLLKAKTIRGVCDEASRESKFIKRSRKLVKNRFVDFPIPGNIEVYGDKMLVMSWSKTPVAFLITSNQITSVFREYFESIWTIAKK